VLLREVDRMLSDPRSEALVEHFTRQWLGLDRLEGLEVDSTLYPEYDLALSDSMVGESIAFFREVLRSDLSLYQFIDSDFLMLNEPIARHYGIEGVTGGGFRKVVRRRSDQLLLCVALNQVLHGLLEQLGAFPEPGSVLLSFVAIGNQEEFLGNPLAQEALAAGRADRLAQHGVELAAFRFGRVGIGRAVDRFDQRLV